jgi:hypothetical protein
MAMPQRDGTVGRAAIDIDVTAGRGRSAGVGKVRGRAIHSDAKFLQSDSDVASTVARVREFCLRNKMKSRGRTNND